MNAGKVLIIFVALFLAGGCATVKISSPGSLKGVDVHGARGQADRAIMIGNEGYYLFHTFPLCAGDVTWDEEDNEIHGGFTIFSHQLAGDLMIGTMSRYAESLDCDLVDIVINNKDECGVNFFSITDIAKTIVGYQSVTYSGVLVPKGDSVKKGTESHE